MDILNHFIPVETEDQRASAWTRGGRQLEPTPLKAPNFSAGSATRWPYNSSPASVAASRPRLCVWPLSAIFEPGTVPYFRTSLPHPGVAARAQACPYWDEVSKTGQACLILAPNNNLFRPLRSGGSGLTN